MQRNIMEQTIFSLLCRLLCTMEFVYEICYMCEFCEIFFRSSLGWGALSKNEQMAIIVQNMGIISKWLGGWSISDICGHKWEQP